MKEIIVKPIGVLRTQYTDLHLLPKNKQAAARSLLGVALLDQAFADGLQGIAPFDLVWLIYYVKKAKPGALRIQDKGVYATRLPNRHNQLGMSLVEVVKVEGEKLYFIRAICWTKACSSTSGLLMLQWICP